VGNAEQLVNDGDTLFLFENNPEIKSKIGMIDWYRLPDTITAVQSGTDYLYPEHGAGYMIKNGATREYFWVFDYDSLRVQIDNITAKLTCENTELTIDGKIPSMQYHNVVGKLCKYTRLCQVIYLDKQWESDGWIDSTAVSQTTLQSTINVGASPVATDFTIVDHLAVLLEIEGDSIRTMTYDPVALKAHPQALVTTRPNDKSNEVERPVDPETLIRRSAPLEVEFKANALNTEYYKWTLYQGSEEFLTRNEAQHKYNFQQPGNYRAALEMTNSHGCSCQSEDFDVSVSESMLIVPNVFTPNGDGTHDEFRVVYRSLKEFQCWIYNRWGHLVYKWDDPAKGWDGTIHGRPAAAGAYYYVIRALGTDADVDYMSKPKYSKKLKKGELPMGVYQLSGDINLLR
jgi:gliding motility-associated-like protein